MTLEEKSREGGGFSVSWIVFTFLGQMAVEMSMEHLEVASEGQCGSPAGMSDPCMWEARALGRVQGNIQEACIGEVMCQWNPGKQPQFRNQRRKGEYRWKKHKKLSETCHDN